MDPNEEKQPTKQETALALLLSRLDMLAQETRLLNQSMSTLQENQVKDRNGMIYLYKQEKQRNQQALQAVQSKLHERMEATPRDPATDKILLQHAVKKAEQQAKHKRQTFVTALKQGKYLLGNINNLTGEVVSLTINGATKVIQPGMNTNIPQPFIETWEMHLESVQESEIRANAAEGMHTFGNLEIWREAGQTFRQGNKLSPEGFIVS